MPRVGVRVWVGAVGVIGSKLSTVDFAVCSPYCADLAKTKTLKKRSSRFTFGEAERQVRDISRT